MLKCVAGNEELKSNEKKLPTEATFLEDFDDGKMHDLIPSVEIDKIMACRKTALLELEKAMQSLKEAKRVLKMAGCAHVGGMSFPRIIESVVRLCEDKNKWEKIFKKEMDREIWQKLMHDSGMISLMNSEQREKWEKSLYTEDMPEAILDNVLASFEHLHNSSNAIFEEGIVGLFRKLSWEYKTNNPRKFGKKIIIESLVECTPYGARLRNNAMSRLDDLTKAFCLLDKKPVPDFRYGSGAAFHDHVNKHNFDGEIFETEYYKVKYFKKGSGHVYFKDESLVDKLNEIISRHYPNALPSA